MLTDGYAHTRHNIKTLLSPASRYYDEAAYLAVSCSDEL